MWNLLWDLPELLAFVLIAFIWVLRVKGPSLYLTKEMP